MILKQSIECPFSSPVAGVNYLAPCLEEEKEARPEPRPRAALPEPDSSSPSVAYIVSYARETTPREWERGHQSTSPPSWSTSRQRSSSWPATLPATNKKQRINPPPPPTRHPQRRGVEQAAPGSDHRPGRRSPQHTGRPPAQEERGDEQAGLLAESRILEPRHIITAVIELTPITQALSHSACVYIFICSLSVHVL